MSVTLAAISEHADAAICAGQELTSICVRRPSHSFFSASISAFSDAIAVLGWGCYLAEAKRLTVTKRRTTKRKKLTPEERSGLPFRIRYSAGAA